MYEDALGSFEQGLRLNPTDYKCWKGKGFSYLGLGYHEEARESFLKVNELHPETIETLSERIEKLNNGDFKTFEKSFVYSLDDNDKTSIFFKTRMKTPLDRNGQIQLFGIRYATKATFTAQDGYDYPLDRGYLKTKDVYTLPLVKEIVKTLNEKHPQYKFIQFPMRYPPKDPVTKPLLKLDLSFIEDLIAKVLNLQS